MSRIRTALVAFLAMSLLVMSAGLAHADNLQVIDLTIDSPKIETVNVGQTGSVTYRLAANSGDAGTEAPNGCNASDGTGAIVTLNLPSGVTASPNPFTLTNCKIGGTDNGQAVQFSSNVAGDYLITATVTDSGSPDPGSYNEAPATFTLHVVAPTPPPVEQDTTAPVIVVHDMTVEGNTTNGANVSDYDGAEVTVTDNKDQNPVVTFNPTAPKFFSLGSTPVTVNAEDDAGNKSSATFNVIVVDTTKPAISNVPGDITRYGWNGFFQPIDNGAVNKVKAGQGIPVKFNLDGPATATWTPLTATDIVDPSVTVTCDHDSGESFPQGVTTVKCEAIDDSGNKATAEFDVTVTGAGGSLGLGIMAPGSPSFFYGSVPPATPVDDIEVTTTSTPGLTYDALANQYVYVWKTSKEWANKAGTLKVQLADGSQHTAMFNFTK
jgi:hypothetical protein